MKTIPIFLIITLAIFASCTDSNTKFSTTDQYQKDSVFHFILADNNLANEMVDSLITKYPGLVQRKLDFSKEMASINGIIDEPSKPVIDSLPVKAETPKSPVAKPVTMKTPEASTTEPIETKQQDPKVLDRQSEAFQFSTGEFKVDGTSSLHDWDLTATNFTTSASILLDDSRNLKAIESLTLTLPVKNLSNKDSKLTKNAWDALNADQHKNITYKVTNATIVPQQGGTFLVKTTGILTIAGVPRSINLDATCQVNSENTITLTGNTVINMTDYNVKPPTFMLGAMKTGEKVTLNYKVVLSRMLTPTS